MGDTVSAQPAAAAAPSAAAAYGFEDAADPAGAGRAPAQAAGVYQFEDAAHGNGSAVAPQVATGYLPNIWAGVHEGAAALARMSEESPWRIALEGSDKLFGTHLAQYTPSLARMAEESPAVTQVEPEPGTLQGPARIAARGATTMLGPAGVGMAIPEAAVLTMGSPIRAAAVGAGSALTGASFADLVPDKYKSVADFAGQMLGGGLVLGGEAAIRVGGRTIGGAGRVAAGPLSTAEPAPIVNPETGQPFTAVGPGVGGATGEPIAATPKQQALAARRVAGAMGMAPEEAAARIPTGPWGETPPPGVPGVQQTIGQVTGNLGALGAERMLRNQPYGRAAFTSQEASNDLARVAALQNAAPADVSDAAGNWFRSKLTDAQTEAETTTGAAQGAAGQAAEAAGVRPGLPGVQEIGGGQREALEAQRQPAKTAASAALQAIDPEGKLALDLTPVGDAARNILAEEVGEGGALEASESGPLNAAAKYTDVEPFQKLRSLMGNVSGAMRRIAGTPGLGRESQPYRRMSMLMGSIQNTMAETASRVAGEDAATAGPGGRLVDRFQEIDNGGQPAGGAPGGPVAPVAGGVAGRTPGAAGEGGAAAPRVGPAGGQAAPQGGGGVAPAPAAPALPAGAPRRPESLTEHLFNAGGLKPHGDLSAMDLDKLTFVRNVGGRPRPLPLVNKNGMSLDKARELVSQGGNQFIGPNSGTNELLDALREERSGRPVYRPEDAYAAEYWRQEDARVGREQQRTDLARATIERAEMDAHVKLSQGAIDHATNIILQDPNVHPLEALRQASYADEERVLQQNAQLSGLNLRPGVSPLARQAEAQLPGGRSLVENFGPEPRAELRAANKMYADYKDTYRRGAVGEVLASGPTAGTFRLGDSAVPGRLFRPGAAGAEAADSLIKAAGSPEAAERVLGDYPALALRNAAMKDGVLSVPAYERFKNNFAPALAKFPNVAAKFATAADAQRAALDAAARGQENIRAIQDSAARFYLGKGEAGVDNQKAIGSLLASKNPAAEARALMKAAAPNDAATDGIRRNFLEHLLQRATGTAEAGTTGASALSGAAYQRLLQDPRIARVAEVVLRPDQLRVVKDVGADLRQAARAWNAVKIPGSPGSAADLHALESHGHPSLFFQMWLAEQGGEVISDMLKLGGIWGAAARVASMVATKMVGARMAAGHETVNGLVTEMQLNPSLGRTILKQAAVLNPQAPILHRIAQRLVALGTGASAASHEQEGAQ